jgi:hypothetical protein
MEERQMANDIQRLAAQYVSEVLSDQQKLGYPARVPAEVEAEARKNAESALRELSASRKSRDGSLAA